MVVIADGVFELDTLQPRSPRRITGRSLCAWQGPAPRRSRRPWARTLQSYEKSLPGQTKAQAKLIMKDDTPSTSSNSAALRLSVRSRCASVLNPSARPAPFLRHRNVSCALRGRLLLQPSEGTFRPRPYSAARSGAIPRASCEKAIDYGRVNPVVRPNSRGLLLHLETHQRNWRTPTGRGH